MKDHKEDVQNGFILDAVILPVDVPSHSAENPSLVPNTSLTNFIHSLLP